MGSNHVAILWLLTVICGLTLLQAYFHLKWMRSMSAWQKLQDKAIFNLLARNLDVMAILSALDPETILNDPQRSGEGFKR